VKIDPEKLSTKFEDWIKKDLLELNTMDVENLRIKDYSIVQAVQGTFLEPRFEIDTSWSTTENKWNLDNFVTFKGKDKTSAKLLENEELNKQKLDDLKTAVDDLSIVDVRRKPKGLGANLRAGADFANDTETRQSLLSRGFYLNPTDNDQFELLAANGEVHVGLKDGVQYVLRFGNVAESSGPSKDGKLNRYLLVTARVDESKVQAPSPPAGLDPAKAAEVKAAWEKAAAEKAAKPPVPAAAGPASPEKPGAATAPAPEKPAAPAPAAPDAAQPAKTEGSQIMQNGLVPVALMASPEEAAPAPAPAPAAPAPAPAPAPAAAAPAAAAPAPAPAPAPAVPAPAAPAPAAPAPAPAPAPEAAKPAPAVEAAKPAVEAAKPAVDQEKLVKEYQRQLDEWSDKKKKANNKVRELNSRFADWYYVISEDVYKKIHLGRSDIIKESEKAKESGFGVDALRDIEARGVENKKTEPAPNVNPGMMPGMMPGMPPGMGGQP
jgi:hypothetical protein